MLKNFTIKTKLFLGFTAISSLVFFIGLVSLFTTEQNVKLFTKIVSVDTPRLQLLLNIKSLVNEIEAEAVSYNLTSSEKNELLASLEQLDSFGKKYDKLTKEDTSEETQFFESLSFIQKSLIQDAALLVNYKEQQASSDKILPLENKLHNNILLLKKKINLQITKEQRKLKTAEAMAFASNNQTIIFNTTAVIIAFGIAFFIGIIISRIIVRPIIHVRNAALEIAEGKLDKRVIVLSHDEIGQLATTFNEMAKKLEMSYAQVEQKVKDRTYELHQEQIKLRASINSLSVGFIMVDRTNNITIINKTAKMHFCVSPTSPIVTDDTSCTLTQIEDKLKNIIDLRSYIDRCLSEKKIITISELAFQNKFFKILISPIIATDVIGAVILIEDITETKVVERSKDEFFSIASHELRTPLTAIRGNTSMIKEFYGDKIKEPVELAEMITDIHESSVRLIELVNDFLDTSRLEQGKMDFKKELIDVSGLVNSVLKEYQVTGSQNKVALVYNAPPTLPQAYADFNKSKQVLINLIGNALKFTKQGSITITAEVINGFVTLLVTDTGRGISLANQHLLFHKFQQAGNSLLTRDTTRGTGLGLYISRLITKGMGGEIKLESSIEGKGSTFSFTLPIATEEQLKQKISLLTSTKVDTATGITQKEQPLASTQITNQTFSEPKPHTN